MLRRTDELIGYAVHATDGELGNAMDFYFDTLRWTVRYLLVDSATWLGDRQVLIAPPSLGQPDVHTGRIPVNLSRQQIANSPPVTEDQPLTRQWEQELATYYGWPLDRPIPESDAPGPADQEPVIIPPDLDSPPTYTLEERMVESWLRSAKRITEFLVLAADGEVGPVDDLLIDTDGWIIKYLIVQATDADRPKKVLLAPEWATQVTWTQGVIEFALWREQMIQAPEYDDATSVSRDFETTLSDYYGRPYRGE